MLHDHPDVPEGENDSPLNTDSTGVNGGRYG